jgi:L-alanine-DL-glutamate epimerase-like enolase superfamily enzyme
MTMSVRAKTDAPVEALEVSAYTIPTDQPESDGTLAWDSTTLVVVDAHGGGDVGIGWTYSPAAAGALVSELLESAVRGVDALDVPRAYRSMQIALRNAGATGLGAMALSAVDIALWDLKARLLGMPLASLLGRAHDEIPLYGSGGFCSYTDEHLVEQLAGWRDEGFTRMKIKVGRTPERDPERVRVARQAIGADAELYVDANGAFGVGQARRFATTISDFDVTWFEEPVSSRDVAGLRLLRGLLPAGMEVAAGEYAATPADFRELIGAVDCLQADATRCGGVTGLLAAAALAEAHSLDLSGHTAPTVHSHVLAAVANLRHLEWFHDHVRIERLAFDGFVEPAAGSVRPDASRPGLGVELRRSDLTDFRVA